MDDEQAKMCLDKIINIEKVVAEFYNILFELELYNNKNSVMYDYYLKLLRQVISDEEKLFLSFTRREIDMFSIYLDKNLEKIKIALYDNGNVFTSSIVDRIVSRLPDDNSTSDINNKARKFICQDMNDILLSFVDEEITLTSDNMIRKKLIGTKYIISFVYAGKTEDYLIDGKFTINKNLYLSGELYANLEGIDGFSYRLYKSLYGVQIIDYIIADVDLLKKNHILTEFDKKYFSLKFRTANLLFDLDIIRTIPEYKNALYIDYSRQTNLLELDSNILEKIKSDRERHKTLSLYIK